MYLIKTKAKIKAEQKVKHANDPETDHFYSLLYTVHKVLCLKKLKSFI